MDGNRKYKDSVFSRLFSDPDVLRELYAALEGVPVPDGTPVTVNTMENVLFMGRVNDVSFQLGDRLVVVVEHQSSLNPNMPLRALMYIARLYEKVIDGRKIYSTSTVRVPSPEFFVLYNGKDPCPDEKVLRLSDAFADTAGLLPPGPPALDLAVKVLNINRGHNAKRLRKSRVLSQYSAFIAKVRDGEKAGLPAAEAIKRAVQWCVRHDILRQFLEANSSEVTNMLITEWNWNDALAVRWEEGVEKGIALEKKRSEKKLEAERMATARALKAKGVAVDVIADVTKLAPEAIRKLR
ncbi:MAG: hypothetical protein LBT74_12760 [Acidobacteriota bacterium]|jgi:hypothetical protein|nr:hypothetical protein [Acidobacteriota bacterium]